MKKLISVAALVLAAAVVAQSNAEVRLVPQILRGGFWSGSTAQKTAANKVTEVLAGALDYDFALSVTTCADSPAITVTGAQSGDPCMVGFDPVGAGQGDAGVAADSMFECFVSAADAVNVRHCAHGIGSNPGDAGFRVRVIGNR